MGFLFSQIFCCYTRTQIEQNFDGRSKNWEEFCAWLLIFSFSYSLSENMEQKYGMISVINWWLTWLKNIHLFFEGIKLFMTSFKTLFSVR